MRLSMLAPFRVKSFRFQWPADLMTSWAFEMETLILGWYVLVSTESVLLLTLFGSLLWIGTLVAPMFGVVGDRVGHRKLLFGMRGLYLVLAAILMLLAYADALTPTYVLVIAALAGLVRPSDLGVRNALVAMTVPFELLVAAIGISRTTSDTARIMGALAGAGLFVAFGIAVAYLAIIACYAAGVLLLIGAGPEMRSAALAGAGEAKRLSPWRDLTAGLSYVWNTPRLAGAMWLAFLVNLTAFPMMVGLLPYIAREVYHVDQAGLGYLVASLSAGAVLGSLILSTLGDRLPLSRIVFGAVTAWYLMLIVFGQMRGMTGGILCLLLIGISQSLSMVALAVILMRTSEPRFRGRVMGVRMLAIYGLPVGILAAGAMIERIGYVPTTLLYAAIGLIVTLIIVIRWRADLWQSEQPTHGP
jgi:MFS family permease